MKIDLEKLGLQRRHADYIVIAGDTVVIVEETSRAKIEDIDKLVETVEALHSGELRHLCGNPSKIIAVLHASREVDPMISRILRARSKKSIVYRVANCKDQLRAVLSESGPQLGDDRESSLHLVS